LVFFLDDIRYSLMTVFYLFLLLGPLVDIPAVDGAGRQRTNEPSRLKIGCISADRNNNNKKNQPQKDDLFCFALQ
jgi:hypothetical protein